MKYVKVKKKRISFNGKVLNLDAYGIKRLKNIKNLQKQHELKALYLEHNNIENIEDL